MGGGFVVADGGKAIAELALPMAGLMSLERFETVSQQLEYLQQAARALAAACPNPAGHPASQDDAARPARRRFCFSD
jgi:adenine deaminase